MARAAAAAAWTSPCTAEEGRLDHVFQRHCGVGAAPRSRPPHRQEGVIIELAVFTGLVDAGDCCFSDIDLRPLQDEAGHCRVVRELAPRAWARLRHAAELPIDAWQFLLPSLRSSLGLPAWGPCRACWRRRQSGQSAT